MFSSNISKSKTFRKRKRKPGSSNQSSGLSMFSTSSNSVTGSDSNKQSKLIKPPTNNFKASLSSIQKAKEQQAAALAVDPNIFNFDAHLSQREKEAKKQISNFGGAGDDNHNDVSSGGDGESRYINNMLKKTELRKKEQERAYNKMQRRKADQESAAYGDTEKFVTPAYKALLEKEQQEEERERLQEMKNSLTSNVGSFLLNITKQQPTSSSSSNDLTAPPVTSSSSSSSLSSSSVITNSYSTSSKPTASSLPSPTQSTIPPPPLQHNLKNQEQLPGMKEEAERISAEEQKTKEKIVAARARYLLRKASQENNL